MKKVYVLVLFLLLYSSFLCAQSLAIDWSAFQTAGIRHQQKAMWVLGGWALGNMAVGGILSSQTEGSQRYFHQMNMYWNVVNLGIAGLGYYGSMQEDLSSYTPYTSVAKHYSFQKVLLFNAGLDVGYLLGGLYLQERSRRGGSKQAQLKGFGQAIVLQGGFLLAFDLANYWIATNRDSHLQLLLNSSDGPAIGLSWLF